MHRPLVVFTPKSLLRAKAAVSAVGRLHRRGASGRCSPTRASAASRWTTPRCAGCCCAAARSTTTWLRPAGGRGHAPTSRSSGSSSSTRCRPSRSREQLERYPNATDVVWVQEEPANMGAWQFMARQPARAPARRAATLRRVSRQGLGQPGRRLGQGARGRAARSWSPTPSPTEAGRVYFTDRGLEELADRRGEEQVTLAWLADQLQAFVDQHPEFEVPVERLATWLARGGTGRRRRRVTSDPRRRLDLPLARVSVRDDVLGPGRSWSSGRAARRSAPLSHGRLYLPALPSLQAELGSRPVGRPARPSSLAAIGVSPRGSARRRTAVGPASARRGPPLTGVGGWALGSLLCAVSPTIWVLCVARCAPGLRGSRGDRRCGRAVVRDRLAGTAAAARPSPCWR